MNLLTEPRTTVGEMMQKIIIRNMDKLEEVEINFLSSIRDYYKEIPYIPLGSMDKDLVKYLESFQKTKVTEGSSK